MDWLLEDPSWIILAGVAVELALGTMLYTTGRGKYAIAMGATLLIVLAALLVEWLVVTDVERIEDLVARAATAAEAENAAELERCIAPSASDLKQRFSRTINRFDIEEVDVYALSIDVNPDGLRGAAEFTAHVSGRYARDLLPYQNVIVRIRFDVVERNGQWLIERASVRDPHGNTYLQ